MVTAKGEFRDFVHEYGDRLARVAWMPTIDRDAVPDVVQTALVKTFVHWSRARATDPYRYARRALVTTVIDRHRREQQHGRALSILRSDAREVPGPAEQVELRSDIASALATLAPRQRAVVALKYIDDLSERDIAETLGISVGTVKSTVSRALPLLRTALTVEEAR